MIEKGIIKLNDFLKISFPALDWLIKDLFLTQGVSLLTSKPKVGKTTFIQYIITILARGLDLDHKEFKERIVLYYCLEEIHTETQRRLIQFGLSGSEEIYLRFDRPEKAIEELSNELEEINPDFVVIDTLGLFITIKDFNNYSEVNPKMAKIRELSRKHNTHICLITHSNKKESGNIDSILGSTALAGAVDNIIMLTKNSEGKRSISTDPRYGTPIKKSDLLFNDETNKFIISDFDSTESTKSIIKENILYFISTSNTPLKRSEIEKNVKGRAETKRKLLSELVSEELVDVTGKGDKTSPRLYSTNLHVQCPSPKEADYGQL